MPITTMLRLARWGTLSFVALASVAIALYPGGTLRNPSTHGYRPLQQFGSDLGMSRAWNGQSNRLGAGVFVMGELALAAAIGALVTGMVSIAASGVSRLLARVAGAAGIVAGSGFVVTAFTAPDRFPVLHVRSAALAFRAACVAALLLTGAILFDPRFTRRTVLSAAGTAFLLLAFVGVTTWGPRLETDLGFGVVGSRAENRGPRGPVDHVAREPQGRTRLEPRRARKRIASPVRAVNQAIAHDRVGRSRPGGGRS